MEKKLKISKLDAAKRQLETAIKLYFNDADPVSIHTLAAAAHEILADLSKNKGHPMILSGYLIKDGAKKEFQKLVRIPRNHFKHADIDPDSSIDFAPEVNDVFIIESATKYEELTGEIVPSFRIFQGWFASHNIDMFTLNEEQLKMCSIVKNNYTSKAEYYSKMLSQSGYLRP